MESIMIALPAYKGNCTAATAVSVSYTVGTLVAKGLNPNVSTLSMPSIALLRNLFLSVWHEKTDYKYLLFVDDDMEFAPDLVPSMIDLDEPVVGALYPYKSYPIRFVFKGNLAPDKRVEHPRDRRFIQADGIGFGCTLIRRDAIDKMLEAGLPFRTESIEKLGISESLKSVGGLKRFICAFDSIIADDGIPISEDLSFCKRWHQVGGKVWAAQSWEIGHVGPHVWRGQFDQFGVEDGKVVLK